MLTSRLGFQNARMGKERRRERERERERDGTLSKTPHGATVRHICLVQSQCKQTKPPRRGVSLTAILWDLCVKKGLQSGCFFYPPIPTVLLHFQLLTLSPSPSLPPSLSLSPSLSWLISLCSQNPGCERVVLSTSSHDFCRLSNRPSKCVVSAFSLQSWFRALGHVFV